LQNKQSHIPYRDSKLTHLLQDSFGGNSKVMLMIQVSPAGVHSSESLCTLNFASRAQSVQLGAAKKNILKSNASDEDARKWRDQVQKRTEELKNKDDLVKQLKESVSTLEERYSKLEKAYNGAMDKVRSKDKTNQDLMKRNKELEEKLKKRQKEEPTPSKDSARVAQTPSSASKHSKPVVEDKENDEPFTDSDYSSSSILKQIFDDVAASKPPLRLPVPTVNKDTSSSSTSSSAKKKRPLEEETPQSSSANTTPLKATPRSTPIAKRFVTPLGARTVVIQPNSGLSDVSNRTPVATPKSGHKKHASLTLPESPPPSYSTKDVPRSEEKRTATPSLSSSLKKKQKV